VVKYIFWFFIVVTLVFPKAGIKVGGFPIYISILSMLILQAWSIPCVLRRIENVGLVGAVLGSFLLFFVLNANSVGYQYLAAPQIFAYLAALSSFVVLFAAYDMEVRWSVIKGMIGWCFWVLVMYAFAQKIFGDYVVVVPGLTANYQDAMSPDFLAEKSNMIWGLGYLKATSTYQNGNLFGVNIILIGFAYISILREQSRRFILTLCVMGLACLLTASVSVFMGFAAGCLHLLLSYKGGVRSAVLASFAAMCFGVPVALYVLFGDSLIATILQERLLNRDLSQGGGRVIKVIGYLEDVGREPELLFSGMLFHPRAFAEIYEITSLSMIQMFGVVVSTAFATFVLLKAWALRGSIYLTPIVAYLGASLSDGAAWLPPTLTNFFIILGACTAWNLSSKAAANAKNGSFSAGRNGGPERQVG